MEIHKQRKVQKTEHQHFEYLCQVCFHDSHCCLLVVLALNSVFSLGARPSISFPKGIER